MPKAIRIQQQGGPEVLKWEDVQVGDPGPGEARMRRDLIGEGMRGVEDEIDRMVAQIGGQSLDAAEAADPHIPGDVRRRFCSPGE